MLGFAIFCAMIRYDRFTIQRIKKRLRITTDHVNAKWKLSFHSNHRTNHPDKESPEFRPKRLPNGTIT
jgi:hypothetical protein